MYRDTSSVDCAPVHLSLCVFAGISTCTLGILKTSLN